MNKLFLIISLLLAINVELKSQVNTSQVKKNVIYLEGAGIGGYGSINYERIIFNKKNVWICTRLGVVTYNLKDYVNKFNPDVIIPIAINGLYGANHKIEIGVGQTISNTVHPNYTNWQPKRITNLHANFTLGYRYQPDKAGFMFRCSYTPIIELYKLYRHWGGVSFGYAF